jgi:hypothetical protein
MKVILALFMCAAPLAAMSVAEAYRDIPHGRTVFVPDQATMAPAEKQALTELFDAVDLAIVAKGEVRHGMDVSKAYEPFWTAWKPLKVPSPLRRAYDLVQQAVKDEQAYLAQRNKSFNRSDPLVHSASGALHGAYGELMRLYPNENDHNKKAFFDYLCALDFL